MELSIRQIFMFAHVNWLYKDKVVKIDMISNTTRDGIAIRVVDEDFIYTIVSPEEIKPILRPLSDATDLELKEIAVLAIEGDMNHIDDWKAFAKGLKIKPYRKESWTTLYYKDKFSDPIIKYEITIFSDFNIMIQDESDKNCDKCVTNIVKITDYLIEKGFNVFNWA